MEVGRAKCKDRGLKTVKMCMMTCIELVGLQPEWTILSKIFQRRDFQKEGLSFQRRDFSFQRREFSLKGETFLSEEGHSFQRRDFPFK